MFGSVGLWDMLFGKRIPLTLPDGSARNVTEKWLQVMEASGKIARIPDSEIVRVHVLDPGSALLQLMQEPTSDPPSHYREETWRVGKDVSQETVDRFRDPVSRDLYVVIHNDGSKCRAVVTKREVWESAREAMDSM